MVPILTQTKRLYISSLGFFAIHFNSTGHPRLVSSLQVFRRKLLMHLPCFICVICQTHLIFLDFSMIWSFLNPLFIPLSHFQKGISLGPFLKVPEEVSCQSKTLKTYLVLYIFTQKMKGQRILNLMLTSVSPGQCAFISSTNVILVSVLVHKCCIWTSAEERIVKVCLLGYTDICFFLIKEVFWQ